MKISIGDNNKIKKAIIGNSNNANKENSVVKIIIEIIVGLIVALISAYIIYKLGWNK